jgi:trehalose 6-phosphate synthase/phosphatase
MKARVSARLSSRSLRLTIRFVLPLAAAIALLAYLTVPLVDQLTLRWFVRDLDMRSHLIAGTLHDPLVDLLEQDNKAKINRLLQRSIQDERLFALGYCNSEGKLLYRTSTFPDSLGCTMPVAEARDPKSMVRLPQGPVHVAIDPLEQGGVKVGSLVLVHDMSFVERRSSDTRRYVIILFAILGVVISLITVLVAHLSWRGWMAGVRAMLRGEGLVRPFSREPTSELQPLVGDLRALLRSLDAERRFADDATISWTPDTLRNLLHKELTGDQVIVVSNREPYIHMKGEKGVEIRRPASGLVTAVEPVMRACSGTWIAHGSGTADRDVVDKHDRVRIPPDHPDYTLRRIWLTAEEEAGYYYGFANEGLWPLCHIAHVRPVFRTGDWERYVLINQRFAVPLPERRVVTTPSCLSRTTTLRSCPPWSAKNCPRRR